jgi:hypothetical protein
MKWWWTISSLLLLACNDTANQMSNKDNDSTTNVHAGADDTVVRSSIALRTGCYEMILKRDTATLSLQVQDTVISGDLNYRWAEKDHNRGSIKGYVQDSLLIADYTFESEGLTSVREVVFKLQGDTLLQGFGELKEQNGKTILTQKNQLKFDTAHPFIKVDCKKQEG